MHSIIKFIKGYYFLILLAVFFILIYESDTFVAYCIITVIFGCLIAILLSSIITAICLISITVSLPNNINSLFIIPFALTYLLTFQIITTPAYQILAYLILGLMFGFIVAFGIANRTAKNKGSGIAFLSSFLGYVFLNSIDYLSGFGSALNPLNLASGGIPVGIQSYVDRYELYAGIVLAVAILGGLSFIFSQIAKLGYYLGIKSQKAISGMKINENKSAWIGALGAILAALIAGAATIISVAIAK